MQYENSTHDSYNYDFAKDSNTMVHVAFTQFFCSAHVSLSSVRAEMCVFSHFIYTGGPGVYTSTLQTSIARSAVSRLEVCKRSTYIHNAKRRIQIGGK